jgi:hypothetical protein
LIWKPSLVFSRSIQIPITKPINVHYICIFGILKRERHCQHKRWEGSCCETETQHNMLSTTAFLDFLSVVNHCQNRLESTYIVSASSNQGCAYACKYAFLSTCNYHGLLKTILEFQTNFGAWSLRMKSSLFWDIRPCTPLKVDQCFGGTCGNGNIVVSC